MGIENSIQQWIQKTLSQRQEFLSGMPACPYASEALLKGQVQIIETSSDRLTDTVMTAMKDASQTLSRTRVHVIAVADWQNVSLSETQDLVWKCRETYYSKDLWLLYDHPANKEVVQDFTFNHGSLLLFFVQKLSDLTKTAQELEKTGYYKQWPTDYYRAVVQVRESYYKKYLEQLDSNSLGSVAHALGN